MRKSLPIIILMVMILLMSGCAVRGVKISFVTIGNPGNPGDIRAETNEYGQPYANPYGCGAVDYKYRISKYEITNAQWNAYAASTGASTNNKPAYTAPKQPINNITWYEAAQFCNYLTSGNKSLGAYQFGTDGSVAINRAEALSAYGRIYVLPTEDEWYKAAYYKPDGNGYSLYANGLNTLPEADNGWNYDGGSHRFPWSVGTGRREQNGTFDIMGNVAEWNESFIIRGGNHAFGERGGSFAYRGGHKIYLASYSPSYHYPPGSVDDSFGFRIVSIHRSWIKHNGQNKTKE